jgi:hypothetical protein
LELTSKLLHVEKIAPVDIKSQGKKAKRRGENVNTDMLE